MGMGVGVGACVSMDECGCVNVGECECMGV